MPNIKEFIKIVEATPTNQAILIQGIHGIGKSECIRSHFEKKGCRMVVLFLGQMNDAGDLTGLPDREINEKTGYKHTIFCPPFWWPSEDEEEFILFLDEINRMNTDIMQCVMDMVLNRRLMGKNLPKNCRIIGAMNPLSDDGYYQVNELDPAFLDRWNIYEFQPTQDEWLDWAYRNKINKHVIDFIAKNPEMLDPKTDVKSGATANEIQQSRRSWEKVSDILNQNTSLEHDEDLLVITVNGIVGINATSRFRMFLRENRKGIHAGTILMNWDKEVEQKVKDMEFQDKINMNRQISYWLQEKEKEIKIGKKLQVTVIKNLMKYVNIIGKEPMAQFFNILSNDNLNGKSYAKLIIRLNPSISDGFFDTLHGKEEDNEEELKTN